MKHPLLDPFRHHVWATIQLVDFCRGLGPPELTGVSVPGTYGTVMETLRHLLGSEAGYRFRLTGRWPGWRWAPAGAATLDDLRASAEESAAFWEDFLAGALDPDEELPLSGPEGGRYRLPVGVLLAHVLDHGSDHRSQVCTVLTHAGVTPPVIDCWVYGKRVGRIAPAAG